MTLAERLAGIHRLSTPIWVFDPEHTRIVWANRAAADLWRASSPEELIQRDFSDMSQATRTRHEATLAAFRQGRTVEEEWTWYPRGVPMTVRCLMSAVELNDGRIGELCEASVKESVDPMQLRGVEAVRHTSVMIALVALSGEVLMKNPAVYRVFGEGTSLRPWFAEESVAAAILRETGGGQTFEVEAQVETLNGPRWHAVEARPTLDPATGDRAALIHQIDVTRRRESDAMVERQRREILSLSAPILEVGERALAVPIIGALDRARGAEITEKVLARVVKQRADAVILDLTGATATGAADLLPLVRALRLLGARSIITGVQPALALEMVAADTAGDLDHVRVLRDLRQGIAACVGEELRL
jgi:anti-anti-sigma regulatory factor/PAS domain-containing protein